MRPDGDSDRLGRLAAIACVTGSGASGISLILAAVAGGPYLAAEGISPWIVTFAVGLMAALFSIPFALEPRLRERWPDRDKRWEMAMVFWAAISVPVLLLSIATGLDTGSLLGAAGLIALIESGLVVGTIAFSVLSG